jgi:hypothetical protein
VERINELPVISNILVVIDRYPRLSAWVVLSAGVVALLIYEARDVGLTTQNWIALIVASIVVSGLCIWIISWEDEDVMMGDDETPAQVVTSSEKADTEESEDDSEA